MGSTGPKGEKKKVLMMEILRSKDFSVESRLPQAASNVLGVQSRSPIHLSNPGMMLNSTPACSSVRSWADEVELGNLDALPSRSFANDSARMRFSASAQVSNRTLNTVTSKLISDPGSCLKDDGKSNDNISMGNPDYLKSDDFPQLNPLMDKTPLDNPAKKSWISIFAENRKPRNGFVLDYVPPSSKDTISFEEDEWNEGMSIWEFSLIGQVMGLNVKFKAMETFVHKVWSPIANPEVCLLKPGIFLFKFKNKEEMSDILERGPWFFGSRPLLLKPWTVNEEINSIKECIYPMWIQLPGLKLNLWNAKSISKIVSIIGKPITTDKLTAERQRLAYARVLIEVSLPTSLPDHISIQGPNGEKFTQKVNYALKPRWCDYCKIVGHDTNFCKRQPRTQRWIPKQSINTADKGGNPPPPGGINTMPIPPPGNILRNSAGVVVDPPLVDNAIGKVNASGDGLRPSKEHTIQNLEPVNVTPGDGLRPSISKDTVQCKHVVQNLEPPGNGLRPSNSKDAVQYKHVLQNLEPVKVSHSQEPVHVVHVQSQISKDIISGSGVTILHRSGGAGNLNKSGKSQGNISKRSPANSFFPLDFLEDFDPSTLDRGDQAK